ncbi:DMT family transporter [bacterium]|nr:DMT family transporter [bacterium]
MLSDTSKQAFAVLGLFLVSFFWGFTFILVKWVVAEIDVYNYLFLRFLVALLFMAIIFWKKILKVEFKTVLAAFVLSIFMGGAYIFQTEGLQYTTASNSALITGLYLVLVPLFLMIFYRSKMHINSIIGALIALVGLYLLTQYSWTGFNVGDGVTLLCALSVTWHLILMGKFTHKHKLIPLVVFQFFFITLFCGGATLIKGTFSLDLSNLTIFTIIVTAIFATVFAFMVQVAAQRIIDPARTGIIFAMEAVFGVIFAYLLGNETLTKLALVGATLMVFGMIISELRPATKYLIEKITG